MNKKITFVQFSEELLSEHRVKDTTAFLTQLFTESNLQGFYSLSFFSFFFLLLIFIYLWNVVFFMVVSWLCVSVAVCRRRSLFGLQVTAHYLGKASAGTHSRNLEAGPEAEATGQCSLLTCSVCFIGFS